MVTIGEFAGIIDVHGVNSYILVRNNGEIASHRIEAPESKAAMVFRCGTSLAAGESRFRCLIFSRRERDDFFIFPVGNYYLGVVKEKDIEGVDLIRGVTAFIRELPRKRS